jgi:nitrite reductase (NADH) large subunit
MKHVIVGNGVAGVTAAQSIVRADPSAEVDIFGAEPYPYYRRPLLWEFIAGQIEQDALYFRPPEWYAERGIQLHLGVRVAELDPAAHRLVLADGSHVAYERLLLATGGRPFIPPCEGTDRDGVFTLRTLDDALAIKAYAQQVSTAIVIGGGLLGLETARALHTAGLEVTVVEFFPYLLPRQLDVEGAEVLQSLLEAQGLQVVTGATTVAVLGNVRADCIRLKDNRIIDGDLVLFSTGMRSEVTLAQEAGLAVKRGIVVDSQLRTRHRDGQPAGDVFAVGDAAEFEGRVYGIIPPAIEQARVAAANMVAPGSATYTGTMPATTLKVARAELTSLGESVVEGDEYAQLRHVDLATGQYRKVVLRDGRIVGAILLNDPARTRPITQLIEREVDISAYAEQLLNDGFDLKSLLGEA